MTMDRLNTLLKKIIRYLRARLEIWRYTRLYKRLLYIELVIRKTHPAEWYARKNFAYITGLDYKKWYNEAHEAIGSPRRLIQA